MKVKDSKVIAERIHEHVEVSINSVKNGPYRISPVGGQDSKLEELTRCNAIMLLDFLLNVLL